jgi:hypothetical protein
MGMEGLQDVIRKHKLAIASSRTRPLSRKSRFAAGAIALDKHTSSVGRFLRDLFISEKAIACRNRVNYIEIFW